MPTISDPNVVRAIARCYVANGRKRGEALIEAGYAPRYANSGHCAKIYDRKEVQEAIAGYEADIRVDTATTVESVQAMYNKAYDLAEESKQPSAMVSAVTGIARLYGMDKDTQTTIDKPKEYTKEQIAKANRVSMVLLSKAQA
jgi:hypothetical protein